TVAKATWDNAVAANTVLFSNASATNYSCTLLANVSDSVTGQTTQLTVNRMGTGLVSPLVIDLNGDGVQTLSLEQGVVFDLAGTGKPVQTGWVSAQDGLLAIDLNLDGVINSGAELLGTGTRLADGTLARDGWRALAQFDANTDGLIDAQDAVWAQLGVWVDGNSDGITDTGELRSLRDTGIQSISLQRDATQIAQNGNILDGLAPVQFADGRTAPMTDAWLQHGVSGAARGAHHDLITGKETSAPTGSNTSPLGPDRLTLGDNTLWEAANTPIQPGDPVALGYPADWRDDPTGYDLWRQNNAGAPWLINSQPPLS
ncbi:MAG: hypothetical protein ACKOPN_11820, partial [Prochlorococcaceae cyanobacterium]